MGVNGRKKDAYLFPFLLRLLVAYTVLKGFMPSIVVGAEPQPVDPTAPAASLGYTSMAPPTPIPHAPAPRNSVLLHHRQSTQSTDHSKHIRVYNHRTHNKFIFENDAKDDPSWPKKLAYSLRRP